MANAFLDDLLDRQGGLRVVLIAIPAAQSAQSELASIQPSNRKKTKLGLKPCDATEKKRELGLLSVPKLTPKKLAGSNLMTTDERARGFYRCQVSAEQSKAVLIGGGQRIPVVLRESAIDGFTVTIAEKHIRRLQLGRTWILKSKSERNHVHPEWVFHASGQEVQLGLRRVSEILQSEEPTGGLFTFIGRSRLLERSNNAELAFAALLLSIFAMLALPGVGDRLGTAPLIQKTVVTLANLIGGLIR